MQIPKRCEPLWHSLSSDQHHLAWIYFGQVGQLAHPAMTADDRLWRAIHLVRRETGLDEMKLTSRPRNCLINIGIVMDEDLGKVSRFSLSRVPNFGKKSMAEVVDALARRGITI